MAIPIYCTLSITTVCLLTGVLVCSIASVMVVVTRAWCLLSSLPLNLLLLSSPTYTKSWDRNIKVELYGQGSNCSSWIFMFTSCSTCIVCCQSIMHCRCLIVWLQCLHTSMSLCYYRLCIGAVINPRLACAARIRTYCLCVCLSVCVSAQHPNFIGDPEMLQDCSLKLDYQESM